MEIHYFNNAATSFPKPASVIDAVSGAMSNPMAEPGRGAGGDDPVQRCREGLADLFGVSDPARVCLLPSCTHALNSVVCGLLMDGGHAIATALEHNSVLRPLKHMADERGARVTLVPVCGSGRIDPDAVRRRIRPDTRLIAVTHASNVTGAVQPVETLAAVAAEHRIPLLLDAAQSAGAIPLNTGRLPGRVYVAFAGHKGLLGPPGTGGLIVPDASLKQTVFGGTGIRSESPRHPSSLPLRHEAGTPNTPGIAGLSAGVHFVLKQGVDKLGAYRNALVREMRRQLEALPSLSLSPLPAQDGRAGVVSVTAAGVDPRELAFTLYEAFGIIARAGLHCAPLIHDALGSSPLGTLRLSVGPFNRVDEVPRLVHALREVIGR